MRATAPRIGIGLIGLAVTALLWTGSAAAADATLYRWVDKDGHVHYGDQAAPNAKQINPKRLGDEDADASDAAAAAASAKQAAECKSKSDQLGRYQSATSITETDALGNTHDYTAEQKDQLVAKTQQYLDQHCSASASGPK
jgi:hypothetical protein